jgi:hypothetical protein
LREWDYGTRSGETEPVLTLHIARYKAGIGRAFAQVSLILRDSDLDVHFINET